MVLLCAIASAMAHAPAVLMLLLSSLGKERGGGTRLRD